MTKHWWHDSKTHTAVYSFIWALALIIAGFGLLYYGAHYNDGKKVAPPQIITAIDLPARLIIPKIAVDANVQTVGTTTDNRVGIPNNFTDVAWYQYGPKPGEAGSAVIDGHLDTATDINAVFIRLSELKAGDEIDVTDKAGQTIKFRVTDSLIYDDANAPLAKIFDTTGNTSRLNLITCDGVWDQGKHNYDKRLVVYSERVLD